MQKLQVQYLSIDSVKPYEKNPRKNDDAVQSVVDSIREYGFRVPILIDSNHTVIAGHTRLKAAKVLGMEEIPCILASDMTAEQVRAFRIADNRLSEIASWNYDLLAQELEGLDFGCLNLDFPELEVPDFEGSLSTGATESKGCDTIVCPKCGFEWKK